MLGGAWIRVSEATPPTPARGTEQGLGLEPSTGSPGSEGCDGSGCLCASWCTWPRCVVGFCVWAVALYVACAAWWQGGGCGGLLAPP
eukprot:7394566-Alexandrium_andersonii.AAC.1